MRLKLIHIARRSLAFNTTGVLFQIIIIILLSAVITGSLMTGNSVRQSLREATGTRLGNTGIIVSTGTRYFNPELVNRLSAATGAGCTGIIEINGYIQNFSSGQTIRGVKIYAVNDDFFSFNDQPEIKLHKGEAIINEKLAVSSGLAPGDEIIIRFNTLSDISSDAPFSPEEGSGSSVVLKTGAVLAAGQAGDFSLAISQIAPLNVFLSISALVDISGDIPGLNRLLVEKEGRIDENDIYRKLGELLVPEDIGMEIRKIPATGGFEIVSDRIFIDQTIIDEIKDLIPETETVITYLANSVSFGNSLTPYSFVSALPRSIYPDIPDGDGIVISRWLADDISAAQGDSIVMKWYSPDVSNKLTEVSSTFIVRSIVDQSGIWADSLLMPQFPGIAGSESCSDWDAGVSIKMDQIRDKDEDYWNKFRGLPKAFISYETGEKLWGNNFGPSTSLRFPDEMTGNEIVTILAGGLDPFRTGFIIRNMTEESVKAASESVDFSTLFLSLGFFIILSSLILLSLVISTYFDSKKDHIKTLFFIGFSNRRIKKLLLLETLLIAFTAIIPGVFAGELVNILIIKALNSVWEGAVQTSTLTPHFDVSSLITGFVVTLVIVVFILVYRINRFLRILSGKKEVSVNNIGQGRIFALFFVVLALSVSLFIISLVSEEYASALAFISGMLIFASLIILTGYLYLRISTTSVGEVPKRRLVSDSYFSKHLSQALTPFVFLAAGIFAVIITSVNKLQISDSMLKPSGGTGGFELWAESEVPLPGNLNEQSARLELGLDGEEFNGVTIVSAKRSAGDDASCLNLNHIAVPPLLGIDPSRFITNKSFSAASVLKGIDKENPWESLNITSDNNTIYGIADQTVLDWGLMLRTGDTLIIRSESGQPLNIIISAGLKASVFQGYVIIGEENFKRYFPSIPGSNVFLIDGNPELSESYISVLNDRLANYGISAEPSADRLSTFFIVTNTYLQVFTILGGFGVILGIFGMGFILLRNYRYRKRDFSLMLALGFSLKSIRKMIASEQIRILLSGVITGVVSALVATSSSLTGNLDISLNTVMVFIVVTILTGLIIINLSTRAVKGESLKKDLRKE